jgi:hypothetical protein
MITFTRHCLDKPKTKLLENIEVSDIWRILKCQYASTGSVIMRGIAAREMKAKINETAITHNFTLTLRHTKDPNRKLDLYAINILYTDNLTKIVKRQSIRYYTMYGQKSYEDISGNMMFIDHLKKSLIERDLDKLFPYEFIK